MQYKNYLLAGCFPMFLLMACNSKRGKITTGYASFPGTSPAFSALNGKASAAAPGLQKPVVSSNNAVTMTSNPPHGQPGHRCGTAVGAPLNNTTAAPAALTNPISALATPAIKNDPVANTTPAPAATTPSNLNPAHGKPGHRCDIAVGAPLNSPPDNTTTSAATATNTAPAKKNTSGLNPNHGEPGHRCDLAIGAPLNSAAKSTPDTKSSQSANSKPLINPPHGEPGHDCSVEVGKPLKK